MSEGNLGQFLQAAYRQLADVERATPPTGAGREETAGQLGRLTGVLSRYLAITGTSSAPVVLEHARQLDTVTEGKRHQIELESELRRRPAQRPGRHDTSRGS
jgi:hypothetical protein